MKIRIALIGITSLLLAIALYFGFAHNRGQDTPVDLEAWNSYSEEQLDEAVGAAFSGSRLPEGQEKALLAWLFNQHPERAEALIREKAQEIARLPFYLSDTALDLVRIGAGEAGVRMLTVARELYPNDPDVLSVSGIVTYLGGNPEGARSLLEEAAAWGQNRPIADFYLGGILVTAESAADQTRGKTLLMDLIRGENTELKQLAGLTLLTDRDVPLIEEDIRFIYQSLAAAEVFVPENPNLSAEALRLIANRLAGADPEAAMTTARLLLDYPGANTNDILGFIQLAQSQSQPGAAQPYVEQLEEDPGALSEAGQAARFARLRAVQFFLTESYEQGLAALDAIIISPEPDTAALQDSFQTILNQEMPISAERGVLERYLELPALSVRNSLQVLSRLVSIAPLQEDTHIAYAMDNLFERNPVAVGSWLARIGADELLVDALEERDSLGPNEAVLLINTYLDRKDPAGARRILEAPREEAIDPAVRSFLLCRILILEEDFESAAEYWEEAHQAVLGSSRFPMLKNLGFLALELDQPVNALQSLYTALAAGIPFTPQQAGQLLQLTLDYGNLQQSIEIAEYLVRIQPDSPAARNNLAYFKFLAENSVEESVDVMRELVEAYPDIHQFTLTLALGLIKAGRTNEANRLIQGTQIDWSDTSNRGRLIYAVVLAATDQRVVADGLIQNLDMEEFIPEEIALLEAF